MALGYPKSDTVLGFRGQGYRVSKFISHTIEPCILEARFIEIRYVALIVVCGFADAYCVLH